MSKARNAGWRLRVQSASAPSAPAAPRMPMVSGSAVARAAGLGIALTRVCGALVSAFVRTSKAGMGWPNAPNASMLHSHVPADGNVSIAA
jgi:hypothetical protein